MNRINVIFIIIGIGVAVFIAFLVLRGSEQANLTSEKIKLINGEISVFQYCSHIGKARIDAPECRDFNLLYGPP